MIQLKKDGNALYNALIVWLMQLSSQGSDYIALLLEWDWNSDVLRIVCGVIFDSELQMLHTLLLTSNRMWKPSPFINIYKKHAKMPCHFHRSRHTTASDKIAVDYFAIGTLTMDSVNRSSSCHTSYLLTSLLISFLFFIK